ncbi:hypothetical protein [uncultured Croceitalea sp.]|uniref:hypothetical protein n=1 Tax=uncultured Croceitalea sp. TaxID=1798908 RepID=UPI0033064882
MGETAPHPIEDPLNVNKRRIELGLLEPVEVYALYHGIEYDIPETEDVKVVYLQAQSDNKKFEAFANRKIVDSANAYIRRAIKSYGDISNEQLYQAAVGLAQLNNKRSEQMSLKILKVLIWREWDFRFERINPKSFKNLQNENGWLEVENLMSLSKQRK